jgi:uncharacterized protein YcsI (UPF0317 family)
MPDTATDRKSISRIPEPKYFTGREVRLAARSGAHRTTTAGLAPGFVQGNLAILPKELAADFHRFCTLNPKPCPVLGISDPGDPKIPAIAADLDIRTDLPMYRVWRNGELVSETPDILEHWRGDLVAFVLGCSFSFEQALLDAGLPLRHLETGQNVPMFRTTIATKPAGPFHGPLVVSMRPFKPADAIRAIQITSRFPNVHGAPVHIGLPAAIGIADLNRPDYDEPLEVKPDELPVFWACGVTPQSVIRASKPSFCITHKPGHMIVTDLKNAELASL